jgi:hypothetical protein
MTFREIRERANRVRVIPLEEVLLLAGAVRDLSDRAKWHTAQGVLSVTGAKFMNWNRGIGGGGAIDLVIHLHDLEFKAAVAWLSGHFPDACASDRAQPPTRPVLRLPPPEARMLPVVRRYLVQDRCLAPSLIEPVIEAGRLYADARGNAVFLLLGKENRPVGAELRGTTSTPWRGMAPGTRKDRGYFSVFPPNARTVVLCESAIDALSCFALHPQWMCISTAGASPHPRWLPSLLHAGHEVYCGFDADRTGDQMARAMMDLQPAVIRWRPPLHDWNDVLKAQS